MTKPDTGADRAQRLLDEAWSHVSEQRANLLAIADAITNRCARCRGTGMTVQVYDEYGMADPKGVPCGTCRPLANQLRRIVNTLDQPIADDRSEG